MSEATLQEEGVSGLQPAAAENDVQGTGRQHGLPPQSAASHDRRVETERNQPRQPDEREAAAGTLRRIVPGGVRERGDEDEPEGEASDGRACLITRHRAPAIRISFKRKPISVTSVSLW